MATFPLKASRFNIAVSPQDNSGVVLLYNTATRALLEVDSETYGQIECLFPSRTTFLPPDYRVPAPRNLPDDLASLLAKHGFLCGDDDDEISDLRIAYENERMDGRVYFTIALTLSCNFACPYCFEAKRPAVMSKATADLVAAFIDSQARAASARVVFVNWFGGEPLLNPDVLVYLSERLRSVASSRGATYSSYVITNGSLLNVATAERLASVGVDRAQVTLDGLASDHDVRRPFRGGHPSFERIVANLLSARDILSLAIRVNVDVGNRDVVPALIGHLAARGLFSGKKEVTIYASPVSRYNDRCQLRWEPIPTRELAVLSELVSDSLSHLGLADHVGLPSPLFELGRGGCSAVQPHSFVIGPDGHLFKCEALVDDDARAVGTVSASHSQDVEAARRPVSRLDSWVRMNPFDRRLCSTCQVVPICKGGCPMNVLEHGEPGLSPSCEYWEANLPALIAQAAKERA